jgi:hypothetical protein
MQKQSEHKDLCGLDHQSIIPYVHERMRVILQCAVQTLAWLYSDSNFCVSLLYDVLEDTRTPQWEIMMAMLSGIFVYFNSSQPVELHETQGGFGPALS